MIEDVLLAWFNDHTERDSFLFEDEEGGGGNKFIPLSLQPNYVTERDMFFFLSVFDKAEIFGQVTIRSLKKKHV